MKPQIAQIPLALRWHSDSSLDEFIDNEQTPLLPLLQAQLEGHEPLLFIHGTPCSGRSHLLLGQCNRAQQQGLQVAYLPALEHAELDPVMLQGLEHCDLIAVDDVDLLAGQKAWESALFSLFNRARERQARLLFSALAPPAGCGFALADLSSRLTWGPVAAIAPMQDSARERLLLGMARRCGLVMPLEVARFILARQTRDPASLQRIVAQLDHAVLVNKRRLTVPFVRELLYPQH